MRIILAVGTALGTVVGVVGVSGAGTAAAQPVSRTLKYTCEIQPFGSLPFTAKIGADIPDSVAVGENSQKFAINAQTTVGADLTPIISNRFGVKAVEGTVDAKIGVAAPQGNRQVSVPLAIAKTRIPASGAVVIKAAGTAPPLRFSRPGTGRITIGDITLHVVGKGAKGADRTFNVQCGPAGGQKKVGSFTITKRGTTTGSTTSGSSDASGSSTTSGTSGTNAKGTTASGTTPEANSAARRSTPTESETRGTATGTTASTGQETRDLLLPAVGALVAAVAAFGFGSRLKNRRRAADDS
ncbi:DUF6801 domain-containing protein [Streptomyces lydicus]|uniref:DUF6801 domain-containing protein n=1 Tax=Streptomyces lydicus TaxID=47763 RepID=UPI000F8DDEF0|nr:DUF6801 domain-containing protein [Streptomyces lydicus]